ncbi:RNA polymerase sigma factor [Chitinophaga caseinilytica]
MAIHGLQSEQDLLSKTASGDQQAFAGLVDMYWNKVYSHALAYTKRQAQAQEITQDIFLHIWHKRDHLAEVASFKNFLFIVGKNQIISAMRRNLQVTVAPDGSELYEEVMQADHPLRYKEAYQQVLEVIEQLPPVRRKVFKLSRIDGLSYEEIAAQLNISRNTVKEHIVKSLNYLRQHLQAEGHFVALMILFSIFF